MSPCYDPRVTIDRWHDADAKALSEPELLLYRSHLLGADLGVTNFGGGNTSAKLTDVDPLNDARVTVLWVKGSGDDLGSMGLSGFAKLYQDKLVALEGRFRGREHEDEPPGLDVRGDPAIVVFAAGTGRGRNVPDVRERATAPGRRPPPGCRSSRCHRPPRRHRPGPADGRPTRRRGDPGPSGRPCTRR